MTTRFRAYQLGNEGSSYSYFDGKKFTLFEARLTDDNRRSIWHEISRCEKEGIDVLHITSWDFDHCKPAELSEIIETMKPSRIEVPGYSVDQQNSTAARDSWEILMAWYYKHYSMTHFSPDFIDGLDGAEAGTNHDVVFWPKEIDPKSTNNNSTVVLFRGGHFNVFSPGDVESEKAAQAFMSSYIIKETDVLILPHHGSEHGIITTELLKHISPKVAVCTANYKNQFKHPRDSVRKMLRDLGITLCTTKMGDVLIECADGFLASVHDYRWSAAEDKYIPQKTEFFYV